MKAIVLMFDSLRRDMLSCYGGDVATPNFDRLARHTVRFENSYAGSLPCMPARRELHTGRLNFLHRSWGPVEPFDDSMPELLAANGVHTHLATDHYHYIQDGGATYCGRYSTFSCARGQESDAWVGDLTPREKEFAPNQLSPEQTTGPMRQARAKGGWQSESNRTRIRGEADYPMVQTFDDGLDFIERNAGYDRWFLQLECFDPHEPFVSPEIDQARFLSPDDFASPDWPQYAPATEDEQTIERMRNKYKALLTFCDRQVGRLLDVMDEKNLWEDTMLICNTDHGFFLGEHHWWGKGTMPNYDELVHTPMFIWDPREKRCNATSDALVQTIDIAPTLLDFFGVPIQKDMLGCSLRQALRGQKVRDAALFGYHGGAVGITDGRWVLLRAIADPENSAFEYTLMPTHMKTMFSPEELRRAELVEGFPFMKGVPVLKIPAKTNPRFLHSQSEDLLFDLQKDPKQQHPVDCQAEKARLLEQMAELFVQNDAPEESYRRYGLKHIHH